MSAEFLGERLLSLKEASRQLPGEPHISTLHRWRLSGVKGVRLRTRLIGGRRFVAESDLREFIDRLSNTGVDAPKLVGKSPDGKRSEIAAAERICDREGCR